MTTSVVIRIILIVALVVFLIVWRSGLREKWKSRGERLEEERRDSERSEARKRRLEKKRREQQQAARTEAILSRAAENARLETVDVAGSQISYFEVGERDSPRSVLLLHGLADRKEDWGALLERLASLGCRAVAPDLPGFGQSPSENTDPDVLVHLRRLLAFVRSLALEPCVLVGSGLGGTLAAAWAYRHPDSVLGLVLIEPFGLRIPYPTELEERLESGSNPLLPSSPSDLATLDDLLFESPPARDPGIEELRRQDLLRNHSHYQSVWQRSREEDRIGVLDLILPELEVPCLYVQGAKSQVVHPKTADLVRTISREVDVQVVPDCGHLPAVEKPQETGSILLSFLRDLPSPRSEAAS